MSAAGSVFRAIGRFFRRVVDHIEDFVDEVTSDPVVLAALEADLGLPAGGLAKAKEPRPDSSGIDAYVSSVKPDAEQLAVAVEFIKAYVGFWRDVFEAAQEEDSSLVLDAIVSRFFQATTVDLIKFRYPTTYYWMRLLGAITVDLRLSLEEGLAPEAPANIFRPEYWRSLPDAYRKGYARFRLDQAADLLLDPDPLHPPTPDEQVALDQIGFEAFGFSDAVLLGLFSLFEWYLAKKLKSLNLQIDQIYGWELPPGTDIPLSERIASRGYTLKISTPAGPPESSSATLTQFFLVEEDGRLGLLFSLRGAVVFTETAGSAERPLKIKITVNTPDGLDAVLRFKGDDRLVFTGAPTGGMKLSIEPAQPSTVGPAISIPEVTGSRLEIGDFQFKVDLSADGFKIKAATQKSALVILPSEADGFIDDAMKSKQVRVEFDLGIAADQDRGVYLEGGGRLAVTIPINTSIGGLRIQSVQLSLDPGGEEGSSELAFTAATSFGLSLGPVQASVEQIGLTLNALATGDDPPDDAHLLVPPFFYVRKVGFRPPSGVGVVVDSDSVSGGGFLFFDKEKAQYAGVVELTIKERLSVKAIGLVTTRLPDGPKAFSFLIIVSVEFDPPLQLFLGFAIGGFGFILGVHRTLDTDVLREGLHNHTLDAVLFPKDPVANAGRLLATLRSVFPPARGRHLFGVSLIIDWGPAKIISAELALIFEWGENHRRVLLGQLEIVAPRKGKPILEVHLDAVGIWDVDKNEFSLDARLYDSHIAFVELTGDMALRIRHGADPFFLLSIGGYHPAFTVPPEFPRLERVTVKFADSKHLRLILSGYFALSSNTRQAGGKFDFFAGFSGFSIEGFLQIDVLWQPDVRFEADFDIKVALKYKGHTLLGAHAVGKLTGPEPKRLKGEVSIDLWLFSVSKSFDKVFGDDRPPAQLPTVDPLGDLVAALADARSWSARLPAGSQMLVSLRKRAEGGVLMHPLGELSVRQQVVPLGIRIDRYAGGVPGAERRFDITHARVGVDPVADLPAVSEFFAPAEFIDMSDDEKLARPSFESLTAGVSLQSAGTSYGGQDPASSEEAVASDMDFDDVIVDADGATVVPDADVATGPGILRGDLAVLAATFGPAGRSALRATGQARFRAPGAGLRVRASGYVVAGVDDLVDAGVTAGTAAQVDGLTYTAASQALEAHLAADPTAVGRFQVVAAFQAEETP